MPYATANNAPITMPNPIVATPAPTFSCRARLNSSWLCSGAPDNAASAAERPSS